MKHVRRPILIVLLLLAAGAAAEENPLFTTRADVIYGRKHALALTMDVFTPRRGARGSAVLFVVSGGWISSKRAVVPAFFGPFLREGHTVFAVLHGSTPKFTISEIAPDIVRAVRFVRHRARDFGVDPERIGILGGSAGGHLALLTALDTKPGRRAAIDPVERESSRVAAVAAFFPPTDFLDWGRAGLSVDDTPIMERFRAPFDFHRFDPRHNAYVPLRPEERKAELRRLSPLTYVSADDPPVLLIHGDRDRVVPLQQSEILYAALERAGVPAELVVKEGAGHGWRTMTKELARVARWFRRRLAPHKAGK